MARPVFWNNALGIALHLLQQTVGTAACTALPAVRGYGFCVSPAALPLQEFLGDTHIDGIPGEDLLLFVTTGGVEFLFDAALAESIVPLGIVEIFIPAIQPCTALYGGFNDRAKAAVAPGKDSLQAA